MSPLWMMWYVKACDDGRRFVSNVEYQKECGETTFMEAIWGNDQVGGTSEPELVHL